MFKRRVSFREKDAVKANFTTSFNVRSLITDP
jgi:hypothetical protein